MSAFANRARATLIPLSTQFSSFRREGRPPASRRCGDHRIRFGTMAEIWAASRRSAFGSVSAQSGTSAS